MGVIVISKIIQSMELALDQDGNTAKTHKISANNMNHVKHKFDHADLESLTLELLGARIQQGKNVCEECQSRTHTPISGE